MRLVGYVRRGGPNEIDSTTIGASSNGTFHAWCMQPRADLVCQTTRGQRWPSTQSRPRVHVNTTKLDLPCLTASTIPALVALLVPSVGVARAGSIKVVVVVRCGVGGSVGSVVVSGQERDSIAEVRPRRLHSHWIIHDIGLCMAEVLLLLGDGGKVCAWVWPVLASAALVEA